MWHRLAGWLKRTLTTYDGPGVGRQFIGCRQCQRTISYYRIVGSPGRTDCPYCHHTVFGPVVLSEWNAGARVLWALVWRHKIRGLKNWDPRAPYTTKSSRYA